jgi:hypothetical protein
MQWQRIRHTTHSQRKKNKWHKIAYSTAAEQYVMKIINDVDASTASESPLTRRVKIQKLKQVVIVRTVSKKISAPTPSL